MIAAFNANAQGTHSGVRQAAGLFPVCINTCRSRNVQSLPVPPPAEAFSMTTSSSSSSSWSNSTLAFQSHSSPPPVENCLSATIFW